VRFLEEEEEEEEEGRNLFCCGSELAGTRSRHLGGDGLDGLEGRIGLDWWT